MPFNPNIIVSDDYPLPQVTLPEGLVKMVLEANDEPDVDTQNSMYSLVRSAVDIRYGHDDDQRASALIQLGDIQAVEAIRMLEGAV